MTGRWLHAGDPRASTGIPAGWHDEIVCHTFRKNPDGSISVVALINLYDDQGNCWTADRAVRLKRG